MAGNNSLTSDRKIKVKLKKSLKNVSLDNVESVVYVCYVTMAEQVIIWKFRTVI